MTLNRKLVTLVLLSSFVITLSNGLHNYQDALAKSIVFFESQRSGKLPKDQTISWRSDSGLSDGSTENVNLSGGYYDAGDNVKFGLPMAFTSTMLAWSILEFGKRMGGEIGPAQEALRWGTDFLLNSSDSLPDALYVQVGNPHLDHQCWQRPEDVTSPRPVFKVTPQNPGSDVAGETAAALAAASLVFKNSDPSYSGKLLSAAVETFEFADKYKGKYSDSLASVVCPFYCSYSGYQDELLWGAAWLYKATRNSSYLNYSQTLGVDAGGDTFSWDDKRPGARILLSRAETFICSILPSSPSLTVRYTPGGLLFKMDGSNLQYVTSSTFLLSTYATYLKAWDRTFSCGSLVVTSSLLTQQAKKQVDYILGDNPLGMSYMVGYGNRFPLHVHHRGSSLPSMKVQSRVIGCKEYMDSALGSGEPNPNVLVGAVIGGPDSSDAFADDRNNYAQSEPATYINAALVGPLAYLASNL